MLTSSLMRIYNAYLQICEQKKRRAGASRIALIFPLQPLAYSVVRHVSYEFFEMRQFPIQRSIMYHPNWLNQKVYCTPQNL
jgi:hypothetical protein